MRPLGPGEHSLSMSTAQASNGLSHAGVYSKFAGWSQGKCLLEAIFHCQGFSTPTGFDLLPFGFLLLQSQWGDDLHAEGERAMKWHSGLTYIAVDSNPFGGLKHNLSVQLHEQIRLQYLE